MRALLAGLVMALLFAGSVAATGQGHASATIALTEPEPVSGDVTYDVTTAHATNPYDLWVRQVCFLGNVGVDVQDQGVQWTNTTPAKGNKFDGTGTAGPFQTSGIHHGSNGDTAWSSDRCEAYVWEWPDWPNPISPVLSFVVP